VGWVRADRTGSCGSYGWAGGPGSYRWSGFARVVLADARDTPSCHPVLVDVALASPAAPDEHAPTGCHMLRARARQGVALLMSTLSAAPPERMQGGDAVAMAAVFAEAERVAAAGKALYARRVKETAAYVATGHHNAAAWLATVSKEPISRARGALETVEQVVQNSAVQAAFCAGELSASQASVVGPAAALRPSAAPELLETARRGSFRQVRDIAARTQRAARGEEHEEARERRVHAGRFCRVWQPESGGLRIDAWLTAVDGARLISCLERETDTVFEQAWASGEREPHERYRADALVRLVCREGAGSKTAPRAQVVVRIDAAALRRGSLESGEVCEIAGVGSVSVATARDLLGDCWLNLLVKDGIDVTTVTTTTRTIRHSLRLALAERDPTCVVPGCPASDHLQIDHWRRDFAKRGPTCLSNLCRLCSRHHAMKTNGGWRLGGGPGKWRWLPPPRLRT